MIGDRDRPRGSWINRVWGITGNDRQIRCWEVDGGPSVPGGLIGDQVVITGPGLGDLLGRQQVGLVIAGVLIGDDPLDPPVLIGGVVLVSQVDG